MAPASAFSHQLLASQHLGAAVVDNYLETQPTTTGILHCVSEKVLLPPVLNLEPQSAAAWLG